MNVIQIYIYKNEFNSTKVRKLGSPKVRMMDWRLLLKMITLNSVVCQ